MRALATTERPATTDARIESREEGCMNTTHQRGSAAGCASAWSAAARARSSAPVHRTAARLDDHYEVVAGVLSRNPERSRAAAAGDRHRARSAPMRDHAELLAGEAARADGIDVLAIMTPNGAALSGGARRARRAAST